LPSSVKIVDGYIEMSHDPGFGASLNREEAAQYPYAEKHFLRLLQAGWERRDGTIPIR
jgi:galactonate dehydratase